MEKVINLSYELHDLLLQSNEFLALKKYEKIMLTDEQSSKLINDYHKAFEEYNFDKSEKCLKEVHKHKLLMDNNVNIINYKKAYKDYMILVGKITDESFLDFKKESLIDKIIRAK